MQADIGEAASNKRSFRSSLKTDSTQQSSKRASRERPAARDVARGVAREGRTLLSGRVVTFRHSPHELSPVQPAQISLSWLPFAGTTSSPFSPFSRCRKIVRGSTPRSRAVLVRLPLFSV